MSNLKYVKKLDDTFFQKFASKFDFIISEIEKTDDTVRLVMLNGYIGPQPTLWVNDYGLKSSKAYKSLENRFNFEWIAMLKKEFGKNYIDDLNSHVDDNTISL